MPTVNVSASGLRFFFKVTLKRSEAETVELLVDLFGGPDLMRPPLVVADEPA